MRVSRLIEHPALSWINKLGVELESITNPGDEHTPTLEELIVDRENARHKLTIGLWVAASIAWVVINGILVFYDWILGSLTNRNSVIGRESVMGLIFTACGSALLVVAFTIWISSLAERLVTTTTNVLKTQHEPK